MTSPPAQSGVLQRAHLRFIAWLPALGWMAVIFRFSSIHGSNVPGRYSSVAHFVEYAILAVLVFIALCRRDRAVARTVAIAVVVASLYAITDEIHQAFVPGRVPDVADWGVDTAGAALAVLALGLTSARKRKAARKGRPS